MLSYNRWQPERTLYDVEDVAQAIGFGGQSVEFANKSGEDFENWKQRVKLGNALHQYSNLKDAENLFLNDEKIQIEAHPDDKFLYSLIGYYFCDLLLSQVQVEDVLNRASETIKIIRNLLSIALDKLSLGRAYLLQMVTTSEVVTISEPVEFI